MEHTTSRTKIWNPTIYRHYGYELCFIAITMERYSSEFREELLRLYPTISIYELFGRADLLLRIYSKPETLTSIKSYLDKELDQWGKSTVFKVNTIHRTNGYDVDQTINTHLAAPEVLDEIARRWPDSVASNLNGFLLGEASKRQNGSIVRAFVNIKQHKPDRKEFRALIDKMRQDDFLKQTLTDIYDGEPEMGSELEGHLLLELVVDLYQDVQAQVSHIYKVASPHPIKTITCLVSEAKEVDDSFEFKFHESAEMLLAACKRKFPKLNELAADRAVDKVACLRRLKKYWDAPDPIGRLSQEISQAIVDENVEGLVSPMSQVSKRLETPLKRALINALIDEFGKDKWIEESQATLKLDTPVPKASLGKLIQTARNYKREMKKEVPLPLSESTLNQFLDVSNNVRHDTESGGTKKFESFEDLENEVAHVMTKVFSELITTSK